MFRALVIAAALVFPAQGAWAQSYRITTQPTVFSTVGSRGTPLSFNNDDDGYAAIDAPFDFAFFDTVVFAGAPLYVGTNGIVSVLEPVTATGNGAIPAQGAPNGFFAPFWDDLYVDGHSRVTWLVEGARGSRALVIEWYDVGAYNDQSQRVHFALRILEATGTVEVVIIENSATSSAFSASIGLEDESGLEGAQYACTGPSGCSPSDFGNGTLIRFTPSSAPVGDAELSVRARTTLPASAFAGETLAITLDLDNEGTAGASDVDVAIYGAPASNVTVRDPMLAHRSLPTIGAGATVSVTFNVVLPRGWRGAYTIAAFVDPSDVVVEADESDNAVTIGRVQIEGGVDPDPDVPEILTQNLPSGEEGQAYRAALSVTGGTAPYAFSWPTLPAWLEGRGDGTLAGTPDAPGSYDVVAQVRDAAGAEATRAFEIAVTSGPEPAGVRLADPGRITIFIGANARYALSATGGEPPYRFSLQDGILLSGLSLDADGVITGQVLRVGTTTVSVAVQDATGTRDEGVITLQAMPYKDMGGERVRETGGCTCPAGKPNAFGVMGLVLLALLCLRVDRLRAK